LNYCKIETELIIDESFINKSNCDIGSYCYELQSVIIHSVIVFWLSYFNRVRMQILAIITLLLLIKRITNGDFIMMLMLQKSKTFPTWKLFSSKNQNLDLKGNS